MKIRWPKFLKKSNTPYNYNRTLHTTSTDFLQHDYFQRMNKTDYTYSRSPSYRRKARSSTYQIPNMSRREVRGGVTPYEDNDLFISDEEEDEGEGGRQAQVSYDSDEEYQYRNKTVVEDGVLLRSGTSLRSERSILEKFKMQNRRSLPAKTSTSQKRSLTKQTNYLDRRSQGSNIVTGSNLQTSAVRSRSDASSKPTRTTSVRKVLVERYEETEMEKGMKETQNKRLREKNGLSIKYGYGLEPSESEYSAVESDGESTGSSMSSRSKSRSSSDVTDSSSSTTVTTVTTTVITTVIESVVSRARPVVEPVWTNVGEPVWRYTGGLAWHYVGQPAWRYVGQPLWQHVVSRMLTTVFTLLSILTSSVHYVMWSSLLEPLCGAVTASSMWVYSYISSTVMKMVVTDAWIMYRRSRLCCFCFPLILLLPLLLMFVAPYLIGENFGGFFPQLHVPNIQAVDGLTSLNLHDEVKKIIIHLQKEESTGLTESDVERIVWRILGMELGNLRQTHEEEKNQQDLAFMRFTQDQSYKLENLQSILIKNISDIQAKLAAELEALKMEGANAADRSTVVIGGLQEDLSALRSQLQNVELAQEALTLQIRNCCKNESFYLALIQDKVNRILGQMMMGQGTGNKDQDAFAAWLHTNFVSKKDMDERLHSFSSDLTNHIVEEVKKYGGTEVFISDNSGQTGISEKVVRRIVDEAITKYNADKIGLPDFALESAGGSVISTRCSETYHKKTAQYSIFGIPLWYVSNSPRAVIQPEVYPGSCWAFQGDKGYLVIELSTVITPIGFSLEHIPKSLAPNGKIDSAPKDFIVLGLTNEKDTVGINLGNYTYNQDGDALQFFPVQRADIGTFKFIELRIQSNHGNRVFTCLYRFRVHGKPYTES